MVEKDIIRQRFARSFKTYDDNAEVQSSVAVYLTDKIFHYLPACNGNVLEVGCGTGFLTSGLRNLFPKCNFFVNDLVEDACLKTSIKYGATPMPGDIEAIEIKNKFDVIASSSVFQWLQQPQNTFNKFAKSINKSGWLFFSTFDVDNLHEVKSITGRGLDYVSRTDMQSMLSENFEIKETSVSENVMYFKRPMDILEHLKLTGVNPPIKLQSQKNEKIWTKADIARFCEAYEEFKSDLGYSLTYRPMFFVCYKV